MALPDLTGINIENSYQRVVHTDGTLYYDGTGSLLNIGGTVNTGSFATTGSNLFRGSQTIIGSTSSSLSSSLLIQSPNTSASLAVTGDNKLKIYATTTTASVNIWTDNNYSYIGNVSSTGVAIEHMRMYIAGNTTQFAQASYFSNGVEIKGSPWYGYVLNLDKGVYVNDDYLRFGTGKIDSSGSLGVGTTSPQRRLHVDASGSASTDTPLALTSTDANQRVGILFASSSLASGRQHKLLHRVNGPVVEWLLNSNAGETAIWRFQPRDDTNYSLNILTPYNGGTTYVTTGLSQSLFSLGAGSQNAQHLNISSSGFVGIGTTTPAYTLDVNGIIQANGNRRILVDSANGLVSIKGSAGGWANYFGFLGSSNGVRGGFGALGAADTLTYYYIGASHTAPTMVLTSGSNLVGINTTSPTATLDVSGSARITNSLVVTGSLIAIEATGNERINTSEGTLSRAGVTSVHWRNRTLNNSAAGVVLNWDTNRIYDTLGTLSIAWEGRTLVDSTTAESINYELRQLYNSVGDTILDYETGTFSGTALFASTSSYVNPLNQDVQITGSLSVSGSVVINNVDIQSTIVAMAIALG